MKILLMGNPNVGKSVIFSLAGIEVISANYPGITVEYTEERMNRRARVSCGLMDAVSTTGGCHCQGKSVAVDAPRILRPAMCPSWRESYKNLVYRFPYRHQSLTLYNCSRVYYY